MSEENFLERWSRRKRSETNEEEGKLEQAALPPDTAEAKSVESVSGEKAPAQGKPEGEEEPAFDLSKLPSIESITATTDIRMFMLPGVPMALRQAALRRVWVTDPKIRDFIEMAENQWDFTVNSPGFDFSPPTGDVKKMVAEILGKSHEEKEAKPDLAAAEEKPAVSGEEPEGKEVAATNSVRRTDRDDRNPIPEETTAEPDTGHNAGETEDNLASQNNDATQKENEQENPRRRHGSALPS